MPNNNVASFPYSIPNDSVLTVASDDATTTLSNDIGTGDTSIAVTDDSSFTVPCLVVIDDEIILVQSKSSNTFSGCIRAFSGSTVSTHSNGTNIFGYILAYHHNQTAAEVKSIGTYIFDSNFSGFKTNENLLLYSENFTNAAWIKSSGATIGSSMVTLPNGSVASTLLEGNSLGLNMISATPVGLVSGQTYTFSIYAQFSNIAPWIVIGQRLEGSENAWAWFNIETGLIGTIGSGAKAAIVPVGDDWFRCMVVLSSTSNTYKAFDIAIAASNGTFEYLGTTTNNVLLCGAQVTSGDLTGPISYIKTIGATFSLIGSDLVIDEGNLS